MLIRVYSGAVLVILGIAGFVVDAANRPVPAKALPGDAITKQELIEGGLHDKAAKGFSHSLYDAVHIGGWALIILGALTVLVGLIQYAKRPSETALATSS